MIRRKGCLKLNFKKIVRRSVMAAALFLFASPALSEAKVVWDGAEITAGQTGKLSFNKDTKIYKKEADGTFTSMVAKKGSFFRVYGTIDTTVGKVYNMSGHYRVNATDLVTYRDIPVGVQDQLKIKSTSKTAFTEGQENLEDIEDVANIRYLEITGITNEKLQRQINQYLKSLADNEKALYDEAKQYRAEAEAEYPDYKGNPHYSDLRMDIVYNSKGYLSIGAQSTTYYGGAHGAYYEWVTHYNLINNNHINLSEFIKTPAQHKKFNDYVLNEMKKANSGTDYDLFWIDQYEGVELDKPFYIQENGIELIFNQYDLAPYAAGVRYIFVPFKAFQ